MDEPVTISTKSGNVVVISEEDLDRMKETIYLMSDPDFMKDVEKYGSLHIRVGNRVDVFL